MGAKERRRKEMGDRTTQVLSALSKSGQSVHFVVCPLCRGAFCVESNFGTGAFEGDHAPQDYFGPEIGDVRCLTCKTCNHYFQEIENSASQLARQREAIREATGPKLSEQPISEVEKIAELKTAFLVAHATLGHTYSMGSGGDYIRKVLGGQTSPLPPELCSIIQNGNIPDRSVVEMDDPDIVLVVYPVPHQQKPGRHAVVLPPANLGEFSYGRNWINSVQLQVGRLLGRVSKARLHQIHPWPEARRLMFHWDLCGDPSHRRSEECFGDEQIQCKHVSSDEVGLHVGWKHRDVSRSEQLMQRPDGSPLSGWGCP